MTSQDAPAAAATGSTDGYSVALRVTVVVLLLFLGGGTALMSVLAQFSTDACPDGGSQGLCDPGAADAVLRLGTLGAPLVTGAGIVVTWLPTRKAAWMLPLVLLALVGVWTAMGLLSAGTP